MKKFPLILLFCALVGCGGGRSPIVEGDKPDAGGDPDGGTVCENENTVVEVPLEVRVHIPEGTVPQYVNNPPVSGEHYPVWARWLSYASEVPRGYWVHNLEHGGVIFLYRKSSANGPDAPQAVIDGLTTAYNNTAEDESPECIAAGLHHKRIVMTPDRLLPADLPWAVVVSGPENPPGSPSLGVGYMLKGACVNAAFLKAFTESHRGKSAEALCDQGTYVPPP